MHESSNHIKHKGEAQGLYVVTHECIIPYSIIPYHDTAL